MPAAHVTLQPISPQRSVDSAVPISQLQMRSTMQANAKRRLQLAQEISWRLIEPGHTSLHEYFDIVSTSRVPVRELCRIAPDPVTPYRRTNQHLLMLPSGCMHARHHPQTLTL